MSSLKLKHSGGNSVSIAAPSSNPAANRTINLNDNYAGDGSFVTANSSGKVGIGTASPVSILHLHEAGADGDPIIQFSNGDTGATTSDGFAIGLNDAESPFIWNRENTDLRVGTNNTERMRIDTDGCLQINQTSKQYTDLKFAVTGSNSNVAYFDTNGAGNNYAITIKHGYASSGQNGIGLRFLNSGGTEVGKIDWGQSTTQYRTSSDYRLKENAVAISDGITRLKTLKPIRFNFIKDASTTIDGFLAHEVSDAIPAAVTGEKDGMAAVSYTHLTLPTKA